MVKLVCSRNFLCKQKLLVKFTLAAVIAVVVLDASLRLYLSHVEEDYIGFKGRPEDLAPIVVVLVSSSSSSFLEIGEYLYQRVNSFFVKDLLRFQGVSCKQSHIAALKKLLTIIAQSADFKWAEKFYIKNFVSVLKTNCSATDICFPLHHNHFRVEDQVLSCKSDVKNANMLIKSPKSWMLSKLCEKHSVFLISVNSLCHLNMMTEILRQTVSGNVVLKIVHLVEDPRAKVYREIKKYQKAPLSREKMIQQAQMFCEQMLQNANFSFESKNESLLRFEYTMIRREDYAKRKNLILKRIASLVDNAYQSNVKCQLWNGAKESRNEARGWEKQVFKWRHHLSLDEVKIIQDQCSDIMKHLNYLKVYYLDDLRSTRELDLF